MKPKEKAKELVKLSFNTIANNSNYKPVNKDGGKQFLLIEKVSKQIAIDFIQEIKSQIQKEIKEIDAGNNGIAYLKIQEDYWHNVLKELSF